MELHLGRPQVQPKHPIEERQVVLDLPLNGAPEGKDGVWGVIDETGR